MIHSRHMDPLTAAVNLLTSVNTLLNTLLQKASTTEVDAMIADALATKQKLQGVVDSMLQKLHIEAAAK